MASQETPSAQNRQQIPEGCGGNRILDLFSGSYLRVPVLLRFWEDIVPRPFGLLGRSLVVEKNLLCYNQTMGKRRRSKEFKNNSQVIDMEQARAQRLEKRRAERQREEKKAQEAARRKTRGKMAIRRSRNRRRLMIGIVVMVIIGLISFSVINIISLKREQHDMEQQKQELEEEKEQLSKELENAGDLQNLEEQARDQLRLIKPGEKIYIFPEEITQTEETTEAEE